MKHYEMAMKHSLHAPGGTCKAEADKVLCVYYEIVFMNCV